MALKPKPRKAKVALTPTEKVKFIFDELTTAVNDCIKDIQDNPPADKASRQALFNDAKAIQDLLPGITTSLKALRNAAASKLVEARRQTSGTKSLISKELLETAKAEGATLEVSPDGNVKIIPKAVKAPETKQDRRIRLARLEMDAERAAILGGQGDESPDESEEDEEGQI